MTDQPADSDPTVELRERYATAMWAAAEQAIVAEWICCEPLNPGHTLCAQGYHALRMISCLIVDSPAQHKPAPLTDAVIAVHDGELEAARHPALHDAPPGQPALARILADADHHEKCAALSKTEEGATAHSGMAAGLRIAAEHVRHDRGALMLAHVAAAEQGGRDQAAIARVRAVHPRSESGTVCVTCSERDYPDYEVPWPCPTITALQPPKETS